MDPYANMGCVLKLNVSCEECKMKVLEVVGSICGTYSISIDAETGLVDITGQVDPNVVLFALAKSGQHAELVRVKLQHPATRLGLPPTIRLQSHDMYGMYSPHYQPYPIHDPYWYERRPPTPSPFYNPSYSRHRIPNLHYASPNPLPRPPRYGCRHHHHAY